MKLRSTNQKQWTNIVGTVLILVGALSVFPETNTLLHNALQITFVAGCILYLFGNRFSGHNIYNKLKNILSTKYIIALSVATLLSSNLVAKDFNQQINAIHAFEKSFQKKEITYVKPYLSSSLKFDPLPTQHTIRVLTNIVTKLPHLNGIEVLSITNDKAYVRYDFEKLGISESYIHFGSEEKIKKIEFVENLIEQQIKRQRKLQSSVQAPTPTELTFKYSKKEIEFPSKDDLTISAVLYEISPNKPIILLCHQAGYNKYEYADIAPRLNKMGFNALAIDQRAGGRFANMKNGTHERAIQKGIKDIDYTDAIQDINSAIEYLANKYHQKVIVWGSSYSASLVLHIAAKNKDVKAVIAFSPGDYFGEKLPSLKTVFPQIEQPFLVTSSKSESARLKKLLPEMAQNSLQYQFIPEANGFHGSKALWIGQKGAEEYWIAIKEFLHKIRKN